MLIYKHDFGLVSRDVNELDWGHLVHNLDGERVINEYAKYNSISQSNQQRFTFWRTTDNFYVHDLSLENPLTNKDTCKSQKLDFFLEYEY